MRSNLFLVSGFALAVFVCGSSLAAELSTPTYLLPQTTVSAAGGRLSTAAFTVDTCVGQESVVGLSTTTSFILEHGFMTTQSTNPVPVQLMHFEIVRSGPTDEFIGAEVTEKGTKS